MRGRYFRDISIMRADNGDRTVHVPEENEVVICRSFFKAGLRFPLSSFVVEVLKIYQIFLHQITLEAIIRMGIFVWSVRSQGLEPSAKGFCSMHELLYETKPWVRSSITTILVATASLLAQAQAAQCQPFGRGGLETG
jgi:hypothetical protein